MYPYRLRGALRNNILLPTLTYGSETWTLSRSQQYRVTAVEISYLRGACGETRWEGEDNGSVYKRSETRTRANGVMCLEVEWVKRNTRNTLNWFGHVERMGNGVCEKCIKVSPRFLIGEENHLEDGTIGLRSTWKRSMSGECLNKQEGSVRIGKGGDSSAVATPWRTLPEKARR